MKPKSKKQSAWPCTGAPCFRIDKSNNAIIATAEELARDGVVVLFEDGTKRRLFCRYDAQTDCYFLVCHDLGQPFELPWYLSSKAASPNAQSNLPSSS
jgi:hypothetical protein